MKRNCVIFHQNREGVVLFGLGLVSTIPYLWALKLQDLRLNTVQFESSFCFAFVVYALATAFVLRQPSRPHGMLAMAIVFAVVFRGILIFTPPTLSDDMYRYVWDGRVQAHGLSPYAYPPDAPELRQLRDEAIWPKINRKSEVTVYPPGGELAFAFLWRLVPDNVHWFQLVTAAGGLAAGLLLGKVLGALGRPAHLVLIYLWNPLVVFETAQAAHIDSLVLPLLVVAWLARVRNRDGLTGLALGAATAIKLYPVLLLPFLWRPRDRKDRLGSLSMPLTFVGALALPYLLYAALGWTSAGYLPKYFTEERSNNIGPVRFLSPLIEQMGAQPYLATNVILILVLAGLSILAVIRPARDFSETLRRCIWPVGAFLLLTQNMYPWYALWLVPLLACFLRPGRFGLRPVAWAGWFLFSGSVALHYTYFIGWQEIEWTAHAEYAPLYGLLVLPFAVWYARLGGAKIRKMGWSLRREPSTADNR